MRKSPTKLIILERKISAAHSLRQILVFALGVDYDNICTYHQGAQDFKLGGVGFTAAGLGEGDGVGIGHRKSVKKNQGVIVTVDAEHYPLIRSKIERNKWKRRGDRR